MKHEDRKRRGDAGEGSYLQPLAAEELAHDALQVDGRFGCGGGSIGRRAVRVGGPARSGPEADTRTFGFSVRRGRKVALGGALVHGGGASRRAAKREPARKRRAHRIYVAVAVTLTLT